MAGRGLVRQFIELCRSTGCVASKSFGNGATMADGPFTPDDIMARDIIIHIRGIVIQNSQTVRQHKRRQLADCRSVRLMAIRQPRNREKKADGGQGKELWENPDNHTLIDRRDSTEVNPGYKKIQEGAGRDGPCYRQKL